MPAQQNLQSTHDSSMTHMCPAELLDMNRGKHLRNICMDCWSRLFEFHSYQQMVLTAQRKLSLAYKSSMNFGETHMEVIDVEESHDGNAERSKDTSKHKQQKTTKRYHEPAGTIQNSKLAKTQDYQVILSSFDNSYSHLCSNPNEIKISMETSSLDASQNNDSSSKTYGKKATNLNINALSTTNASTRPQDSDSSVKALHGSQCQPRKSKDRFSHKSEKHSNPDCCILSSEDSDNSLDDSEEFDDPIGFFEGGEFENASDLSMESQVPGGSNKSSLLKTNPLNKGCKHSL
uniref:ZAD domain-containing protein n=1 Tax=Stomoxys calcitrans TaxID=35570 RepID=A0A1I8NQR8_STOCA